MGLCPERVRNPERRVPARMRIWMIRCAAAGLLFFSTAKPCRPQAISALQREQVDIMLENVAHDVEKHYYDPTSLGSDWNARVREARQKIDKSDSVNRAISHIAALLDGLHDSHTFFLPPARPYRNEYGFQMQMVGDRCYITRVHPRSDADAKGLKPGDQIVSIDGYAPTRGDLWRMKYLFWVLQPQPDLRLGLRTPDGKERQVDVMAKFLELPAINDLAGSAMFDSIRAEEDQQNSERPRYTERGHALLIVKLPTFALSAAQINAVMNKTRGRDAVILDLRGNPGGDEEALKNLLGGMFEKKVKIGDPLGRHSEPSLETEPYRHAFTGRLVVLLDSESGSASELFARVIQLEKRGLVLGDESAGRVMTAQRYMHQTGLDTVLVYGVSVSDGEIRMADGQSLEHRGVIPDKRMLPNASDLASGRDPVLAAAAEMLNVNMSPEEAGALFRCQWPDE